MKKFLLTACAVFGFVFLNAQEQVLKSKMLIEVNTLFGASEGVGSTGLQFRSVDGASEYNFGIEGGYFIIDNLALKAGLGYGGVSPKQGDSSSAFGYKIGAKYYVISMIPVSVDFHGASGKAVEIVDVDGNKQTPRWVGIGAGYAWFLGNNVSLEPGIRYNLSMNDKYSDKGQIQFNIGFALHF